jgi:hypothetical protein
MDIKVVADTESGIIRIYHQDTDSLTRATSSLYDLLELSYSTAEQFLDNWQADFSRDEIDDMAWRIDELSMALRKLEPI